jgi:hypothetical protein
MGNAFDGMERQLRNYVDGYVTWMEREVKRQTVAGTQIEASQGPVMSSVVFRGRWTGPEDKRELIDQAKKKKMKGMKIESANWKEEQFISLVDPVAKSVYGGNNTAEESDNQKEFTPPPNTARSYRLGYSSNSGQRRMHDTTGDER